VYVTTAYAAHVTALLEELRTALPSVTDWVGTVGMGILAGGVEYLNEPALAVMLLDIAPEHYRVFNGLHPLHVLQAPSSTKADFIAHTALVHVDGQTPDVHELMAELAARTTSGKLFGGITPHNSDATAIQIALPRHAPVTPDVQVLHGGFSGVAFDSNVGTMTSLTQGCLSLSATHTITNAEGPLILSLDHRPALDVLLQDLSLDLAQRHITIPKLRQTLVGLSHASASTPHTQVLGSDVRIRRLIGLDIERQGIAVAAAPNVGEYLQFCQRDTATAHTDLVRICTDIREAVESFGTNDDINDTVAPIHTARLRGAVYISCLGRGGAYFGAPHAELQLIRRALGDIPLIGFFASGEIAGQQLYAYTGVLTVFLDTPLLITPDASSLTAHI
jgi:small ligand-binding sensory domain FIST